MSSSDTRLIEELRDEMRAGFAQVRGEMHEGFAQVRGEMHEGFAQVRGEMHGGLAQVRGEMHEGFAQVSQRLDNTDQELGGLQAAVIGLSTNLYEFRKETYAKFAGISKIMRSIERNQAKSDERFLDHEIRLTKLEKKKQQP